MLMRKNTCYWKFSRQKNWPQSLLILNLSITLIVECRISYPGRQKQIEPQKMYKLHADFLLLIKDYVLP